MAHRRPRGLPRRWRLSGVVLTPRRRDARSIYPGAEAVDRPRGGPHRFGYAVQALYQFHPSRCTQPMETHSVLTFAARITLPGFSVSSLTSFSNLASVPASAVPPEIGKPPLSLDGRQIAARLLIVDDQLLA
jgi:hypothetical protein